MIQAHTTLNRCTFPDPFFQVVEFFHDMRRMPPPRPGAASMAPPAPAAAAPAEAAPALPTDGVSHQPTAYYATV